MKPLMKHLSSTTKYLLILLGFSACHRGMICPAFQSSFILDDSVRMNKFSLFMPDSLPKEYLTDKGRYGIIDMVSYPRKFNDMKTVPMVTVFPPPDPLSQDSSYMDPLQVPELPQAPVDTVDTPMITNGKK